MARFVYLISPKRLNNNFYIELSKVLKSKKVKYFQLRLKGQKDKHVLNILKKVKKITKKYRVKLILNDNPYLALKSNVDGCHIGQLDTNVSIARKILKKKILGVTCHSSLNLIRKAENFNADYIGVGSFFKSKLKPKAKKAKIIDLKKIRDKTKLPIVAIGGVNQKNYKKLLNSGANYIAISSFIWNNPILNPSDAIKRIK